MALYKGPTDPDMPKCPRYTTKNHRDVQKKKIISAPESEEKNSTTSAYLLLSSRGLLE